MKRAVFITTALALALAGCGEDAPADVAEGDVTGEVLPGSASDAMIPLDQLRSQAEADPEGTSVTGDGDDGSDEADDSADPEDVEPAPYAPPPAPATTTAPPAAQAPARQQPPAKAASSDAPPPPVSVLPSKTPSDD